LWKKRTHNGAVLGRQLRACGKDVREKESDRGGGRRRSVKFRECQQSEREVVQKNGYSRERSRKVSPDERAAGVRRISKGITRSCGTNG